MADTTAVSTSTLRTIPQAIEERPYITERWMRRLVYESRIPYFKVGGRVLVDLTDIDAYVNRGRIDPPIVGDS